jgi:hypothetical protein
MCYVLVKLLTIDKQKEDTFLDRVVGIWDESLDIKTELSIFMLDFQELPAKQKGE